MGLLTYVVSVWFLRTAELFSKMSLPFCVIFVCLPQHLLEFLFTSFHPSKKFLCLITHVSLCPKTRPEFSIEEEEQDQREVGGTYPQMTRGGGSIRSFQEDFGTSHCFSCVYSDTNNFQLLDADYILHRCSIHHIHQI